MISVHTGKTISISGYRITPVEQIEIFCDQARSNILCYCLKKPVSVTVESDNFRITLPVAVQADKEVAARP